MRGRDHVPLRTRAGVVSMTELVRSSMRLRPDRVVVGEVRGAEALDLIKVWGTGHPGGVATIHAGSALGALLRLEQLILEVAVNPPRALIAEAVNVVIHIAGRGRKRRIESIARVVGFDGVGYQLADALETPFPELPPPDAAPAAAISPSPTNLENCHDADDRSCFPFFCKSGFALVHAVAAGRPSPCCCWGCCCSWPAPRRPPVPRCRGKARCNPSLESDPGPVARIVAVIIIIATGLRWPSATRRAASAS